MKPQLVVGLFQSSGIAEDARNRLKTEGVPSSDIALNVLTPVAPLRPQWNRRSKPCRWTR
jgi:hypothetical protein